MIRRAVGLREKMGNLWCHLLHDSPMWPIHGRYVCRTCMRQYAVPWAETRQYTPITTIRSGVSSSQNQLHRAA